MKGPVLYGIEEDVVHETFQIQSVHRTLEEAKAARPENDRERRILYHIVRSSPEHGVQYFDDGKWVEDPSRDL